MSNTPSMVRRNLIKAGSSVLAFSSVSAIAPLNADTLWQTLQGLVSGKAMVLYRDTDRQARQFAAVFAAAGLPVLALALDPVRQWRDGLGQQIRDQGLMVVGMGNWADYCVVRGLAAEQRCLPLLEMQHSLAQENPDWALQHGKELLDACVCDRDSLRVVLQTIATTQADNSSLNGNFKGSAPSVFSWVMA